MTVIDAEGAVHPRPQLTRGRHALLDGACGFAFDADDAGIRERWMDDAERFDRTIRLPFSPESAASGIADTGFHPIVWYRIEVTREQLVAAGWPTQGERLFVNFGAVDRIADVWFDGQRVCHHEGGHTAFAFDVTDVIDPDAAIHVLVVRAQDDPFDLEAARGKQDWQESPHSIWYHRSTGIVRSVWLEAVPALHAVAVHWSARPQQHTVGLDLELSRRAAPGTTVSATVSLGGVVLGGAIAEATGDHVLLELSLPALRNGQALEDFVWSPETPVLIDAEIVVEEGGHGDASGSPATGVDRIGSYFGIRSVAVDGRRLLLNDRPFTVRAVLEQGYWPDSHFTAPSEQALREEVELIKRLGFNSVRIHQKIEDPRFLYWCDRLGLCVWSEAPAAYEYTPRAVERFTAEWTRSVRAAASHPSVMVWVPVNESWGLQQISHDPRQRAFSRALADLTRALDDSRPVVSNDGWEHTDSDLATVHDYESSADVLRERYRDHDAVDTLLSGIGPAGRRMGTGLVGKPAILSEFGGIRYDVTGADGTWGYSTVTTATEFDHCLRAVFDAVTGASGLDGFCYTQLTDTEQETNGLCDPARTPKIPEAHIRAMVLGHPLPA
ncbi:glycoside hydrolase family 2 protein [Amnibacterium flavum]|nr:glycoside hydrolase family 2 TIM barrel-domain containing protein [Amnibacterium flavum]